MRNLTDIKHRIKSVSDTRQITSAMETISVAKMRKAVVRFEHNKFFFEAIRRNINDIVLRMGEQANVYFSDQKAGVKPVHIVIASDKGLAGGFNTNVLKYAWAQIEKTKNCNVFTVGQTARDFFEYKGATVDIEFSYAANDPCKEDAIQIAQTLLNLYLSHEINEIYITYTKLESSTSMYPQTIKLLPFSYEESRKLREEMSAETEYRLNDIEFEPNEEEILSKLVEQYITWVIYGALIQSSASEHCSRRFAMSNATKNASGILDELKIQYNQARQESITNELSEIITASLGIKK